MLTTDHTHSDLVSNVAHLRATYLEDDPEFVRTAGRLAAQASRIGRHDIESECWNILAVHCAEHRMFERAHSALKRAGEAAINANMLDLAAGFRMFDVRLWMQEGYHGRSIREAISFLRSSNSDHLLDRHRLWLWCSLSLCCAESSQYDAADLCDAQARSIRVGVSEIAHPHVLAADLDLASSLFTRWLWRQDAFRSRLVCETSYSPSSTEILLDESYRLVDLDLPAQSRRSARQDSATMLDVLRACIAAARARNFRPLETLVKTYGADFRSGTVQIRSLVYMVAATMTALGDWSSGRRLLRTSGGSVMGALLPVDCEWKHLNSVLLESSEDFRGALGAAREYCGLAMYLYDRINPFAKALISHVSVEQTKSCAEAKASSHADISNFDIDIDDSVRLMRKSGGNDTAMPLYLSEAISIINNRDSTDLSVSHIADVVGVSERTLRDAFQRSFGVSPKSFILRTRLEHAQSLLSLEKGNSWSISELASICGFNHVGRFSKAYFRLFGVSPSKVAKGKVNSRTSSIDVEAPEASLK